MAGKGKKIKQVIDNLKKSKSNFTSAKKETKSWTERIGIEEELVEVISKMLKGYDEYENIPEFFLDSLVAASKDLLICSQSLCKEISTCEIPGILSTTTSASGTIAITSLSAVDFYSSGGRYVQYKERIEEILDQIDRHQEISQKLGLIKPSLKQEYDRAWSTLRTGIEDKTRGPMFLMREALRQLYGHFAPDKKVKEEFGNEALNKEGRVKRKKRIEYLASKVKSPERKKVLLDNLDNLDIYKKLNKAHKDGSLDVDQTKRYLYLANNLIFLLLDEFLNNDTK